MIIMCNYKGAVLPEILLFLLCLGGRDFFQVTLFVTKVVSFYLSISKCSEQGLLKGIRTSLTRNNCQVQ